MPVLLKDQQRGFAEVEPEVEPEVDPQADCEAQEADSIKECCIVVTDYKRLMFTLPIVILRLFMKIILLLNKLI